MKFHERINRSVAKAISYRLLNITSDSLIVLLLTHRWDLAIGVVGFSNIASSLLYFLHERAWNKIHWGKVQKKR